MHMDLIAKKELIRNRTEAIARATLMLVV